MSGTSLAHGRGESNSGVVPTKQPNKSEPSPAEVVEGRPLAKENTPQPNLCRTPSRGNGPSGLKRMRPRTQGEKLQPHPSMYYDANIRGKNRVR